MITRMKTLLAFFIAFFTLTVFAEGIADGILYIPDEYAPKQAPEGGVSFQLSPKHKQIHVKSSGVKSEQLGFEKVDELINVGGFTFAAKHIEQGVMRGTLDVDGEYFEMEVRSEHDGFDEQTRAAFSTFTVIYVPEIGIAQGKSAEALHLTRFGKNPKAMRLIKDANDEFSSYIKAVIYLSSKNYKMSKNFLAKSNKFKNSFAWRLLDARIDMDSGANNSAREKLFALMRDFPKSSNAKRFTGLLKKRENNLTEAENFYKEALNINPSSDSLNATLASIYNDQKKPLEAYAYLIRMEFYSPEKKGKMPELEFLKTSIKPEHRAQLEVTKYFPLQPPESNKTKPSDSNLVKNNDKKPSDSNLVKNNDKKPSDIKPPSIATNKDDPCRIEEANKAFASLPKLPLPSVEKSSSTVAPILASDFLSSVSYRSAVASMREVMRELAGNMTPEASTVFENQWNAAADYPTPELIEYLTKATPFANEIVSLRSALINEMDDCDNAFAEANYARDFGNHAAAHEAMRRAGQCIGVMKALQNRMKVVCTSLEALGEMPDPASAKKNDAASYRAARKTVEELFGFTKIKNCELDGEFEFAEELEMHDVIHEACIEEGTTGMAMICKNKEVKDKNMVRKKIFFKPIYSDPTNNIVVIYYCIHDGSKWDDSRDLLFVTGKDGSFSTYDCYSSIRIGERRTIKPCLDADGKPVLVLFTHKSSYNTRGVIEHKYYSQTLRPTGTEYNIIPVTDDLTAGKVSGVTIEEKQKHAKMVHKFTLKDFKQQKSNYERLVGKSALIDAPPPFEVYYTLESTNVYPDKPREKVCGILKNDDYRKIAVKLLPDSAFFTEEENGVSIVQRSWKYVRSPYDIFYEHSLRTINLTPFTSRERIEKKVTCGWDGKIDSIDSSFFSKHIMWSPLPTVIRLDEGIISLLVTAHAEKKDGWGEWLKPSFIEETCVWITGRPFSQESISLFGKSGLMTDKKNLSIDIRRSARCEKFVIDISTQYSGRIEFVYKRRVMTKSEADTLANILDAKYKKQAETELNKAEAEELAKLSEKTDISETINDTPPSAETKAETIAFHRTNIAFEEKTIARLTKELATEKDPARRSALEFAIVSARSNIVYENDRIRAEETGVFKASRTPFDDMCQVQIRENTMNRIQEAEQLSRQRKLAEFLLSKQPFAEREVAERLITKIMKEAPLDTKRWASLNSAMEKKWTGYLEYDQAKSQEELAICEENLRRAETLKTGCDVLLAIGGAGGAPRALMLTYQLTTGGVENGVAGVAKNAVTFYSDTVDVAWSAYDGYRENGWKGAVKGASWSIMMNKGIPFLFGKMKAASDAGASGKALDVKAADPGSLAGNKNQRGCTRTSDVDAYRVELENAKTDVKKFTDDYAAFRRAEIAKAPPEELARLEKQLTQSVARINANPTAKAHLKYEAPKFTSSIYDKSLQKIHAKAEAKFHETMKAEGFSPQEIRQIRNKSSEGTTGMDTDLALKEQPYYIQGKRNHWLTKNGKDISRHEWMKQAQLNWEKAYSDVTGGFNARKSWENITTSAHSEAYRNMNILNTPKNTCEMEDLLRRTSNSDAKQIGDVTRFKAEEMLTNKDFPKLVGIREAARGTAKDMKTKFMPAIRARLETLEKIPVTKRTKTDIHNIERLRSAEKRFSCVEKCFADIGEMKGIAKDPANWDTMIRTSTGGKGISETLNDINDFFTSLTF